MTTEDISAARRNGEGRAWHANTRRSMYPALGTDLLDLESVEDQEPCPLANEASEQKLLRFYSGKPLGSGHWVIHSAMPARSEAPFAVRDLSLRPRSKESAYSVLSRHKIAAVCAKGQKSLLDRGVGQDNFSSSRLAHGWRLHCVCDGHGQYGHWVSDIVVRFLPYFLGSLECVSLLREEKVEEAVTITCERMQSYLVSAAKQCDVDIVMSGTTCASILRNTNLPNLAWVANIGDSRVVLVDGIGNVAFSTVDHKPTTPSERARVEASGCEITESIAANNEVLTKIVVRGKRNQYPELGFTRSFGDLLYKSYGVEAVPDVYRLEKELGDLSGEFVIASDGVFEFVSNDHVAKIVSRGMKQKTKRSSIVEELLQASQKLWKEHEGDYCDDITAMLVPARHVDGKSPAPDDSCLSGVISVLEDCGIGGCCLQ
eukprot:TRINITY_DN58407_c0_g1_i1.p1 TRINITY_DN58407_c0_g1~~TRINITY_DN58407_c0_g1_i1.p1  ORF type:complete len:430 (-),score=67.35 TRINITY_DN58407_c0_g1_i1:392-1681(-)